MSESPLDIERLFLEAVDLPPDRREAWVRDRSDVPSGVRDEVVAMLRADRMLGEPGSDSANATDRAGPYELLTVLGRGAGGTVWLSRRIGSPGRTAALKITDSREPEILTRFRGEASALARLEHPGIATIFEFGELGDGRAWFAMTLVTGESIVRHCEANDLATESRVRLVAQACAAVSHAHRRGILHRDLKPSNILVDARADPPRPVVIDLGLAKAIEGDPLSEAERTMPGRIMGTPEFMAPEQALGSAPDVRMDVFSLGCVLAAAVTGGPPRSRESLVGTGLPLFAAIAAVPPLRPSRSPRAAEDRGLARSRWRDLDAIVLKAIAIDPADRYDGVVDLELDLQRWLGGAIPEAARAHPVRRTAAWVRRHRGWAAASALGAIGVAVAITLVLLAAANAARERRDADTLLTMVESMLIAADPWYVRGTGSPIVEQGLSQAEAMSRGRAWGESPRVALLRARCLLVASEDAEAIEAARQAVELEAGRDPALRAEAMIVEAYAREHSRADQSLSFRLADEAVALARTTLDPHDRRLLEMELARGRIVTRRDPLSAMDVLAEAFARAREAHGADDPLTLRLEQAHARALGFTGDTGRSIPLHRELLDRCRRALGPGHPVTMAVAGGLVNSLAYANDWDGTIAIFRDIDPLLRESVGPNSALRLGMMNSVGFALTAAGRLDEAIEVLEECTRRYRELHDPVHPLTTLAERNLMVALERAGRIGEAVERLELQCTYPVDDRQPTRLEIDRGNLEVLRKKLADARGG